MPVNIHGICVYPYIDNPTVSLGHAGWQGADAELALIQQQLDPTQQGKISRDRLLRWLTNYYNAQHVMERVQNEKAAQAKRDTGAGANPVLPSTAVVDESVAGNKLNPRDVELEHSPGTLSFSGSGIDWDAQYRRLLSDPSTADPFVRELHVAALVNRFREGGELVVRKIIEELSLPDEARSVRSLPTADTDGFLATDGLAASTWLDGSLTRYHHDGMLVYMVMAQDRGSTDCVTKRIILFVRRYPDSIRVQSHLEAPD